MRKGENPAKRQGELPAYAQIRVVLPVYIPEVAGYFRDMPTILGHCLTSLQASRGENVLVTVVANGCCEEIVDWLHQRQRTGEIDQLVLNGVNRGKVDAAVAAARSSWEPLIAIVDCDVLFRPGWVEHATEAFHVFPECGVLCLSPTPNRSGSCTDSTILAATAARVLHRGKVASTTSLDEFEQSVGTPGLFSAETRRRHLYVERDGTRLCVGAGHYAAVYRREVIALAPKIPSLSAANQAEAEYLDRPSDLAGWWRLSLTEGCVAHMGNVAEPWMALVAEPLRTRPRDAAGSDAPVTTPPRVFHRWPILLPRRWRSKAAAAIRRV